MNKSNSNYKGGLKKKNILPEEENDVDQNVRPGQQPGKPAPPRKNESGGKSDKDATTPDEFKTKEKANKEARKISENEDFPVRGK